MFWTMDLIQPSLFVKKYFVFSHATAADYDWMFFVSGFLIPERLDRKVFWPRARREVLVITLMTQKKKTFIFWTLKIDLKPLGKIYGQVVDNLETTWGRFIVNL